MSNFTTMTIGIEVDGYRLTTSDLDGTYSIFIDQKGDSLGSLAEFFDRLGFKTKIEEYY